ncbi:carbohydrate ABC transporter permease [Marivibrio halodurans]|uniref:Carbohydrate ABC transporter permease n=1 Tax=Marivibrio halodurans TaxID=2039722 RepID=A0A8J7SN83_9PROT|nr:carbohydrate ABC transporter permease [Marivibrio halodurans]MBP5857481.1 carbohydrate ABC transporter permease [Marivibrio halodurans]
MRANFPKLGSKLGYGALLALTVIYSVFPIYWMINTSFREPSTIYTAIEFFPSAFTWENFSTLLELTDYPTWFANSVIVALGTVAVTIVLSVLIAYAVTRLQFRGKTLVIGTMLYAYMFPPLLLAIPLATLFVRIGLSDTLLSLVISHTTLALPLGVWLLWGFFKQIPHDVEEAAMVDGCSRLRAFVLVVLPLTLPGIVTVAIFAFLLSWTDYVFALVMVSSDVNKTLPVGLDTMVGLYELRWGELMAGSTLIALPLFVMFTFLSRFFIRGLAAGAVKG